MVYEIFENKKSLRYVGRKEDKESFDEIKNRFGFTYDIDLYTFCSAIGICLDNCKENFQKEHLRTPKKMVGMDTFVKRKLFDLIILEHFKIENNRLLELETYFYTGFKIIENWINNEGKETDSLIEIFSELYDYINELKN